MANMKIAKLEDVQDIPATIGSAVTAGEALKLLRQCKMVWALVAVAPGIGTHFMIDKDEAIARLARARPDSRIICDLDADGLCWIGSTVMP